MKLLPLFFLLALTAAAQVPHQHHPPSAGEWAHVLEDPSRDAWQKPDQVVAALDLKPTDTIADLGAGTGYFSRRFAPHAAKVYAVDIDQKLLDIIHKNSPANVTTVLAAPDNPRLPAHSVDIIFICDVLHHIENRAAYFPKLVQALKPGGRIVDIDFHKKEMPLGPPLAMKLSRAQVESELASVGFRLAQHHDFLPYQYFLVFTKR
jgi:arsenite methyltransferase